MVTKLPLDQRKEIAACLEDLVLIDRVPDPSVRNVLAHRPTFRKSVHVSKNLTSDTMDLSHLSEQEREAIMTVLLRDEELRKKESERVTKMKNELQGMRQKGALKSGLDPEYSCARCRTELGRLLNRGEPCQGCQGKVCKECRVYAPSSPAWVCIVCFKQMELQAASGLWMNEFIRRPSKRRDNKVATGDEVKKSIRRSWTSADGLQQTPERTTAAVRDPHLSSSPSSSTVHIRHPQSSSPRGGPNQTRLPPLPPLSSSSRRPAPPVNERPPFLRSSQSMAESRMDSSANSGDSRTPRSSPGGFPAPPVTPRKTPSPTARTDSRLSSSPSPQHPDAEVFGARSSGGDVSRSSPSPQHQVQQSPSPRSSRPIPSPISRPESSGSVSPSPTPSPRQRSPLQKQRAVLEPERNMSNESQDSGYVTHSQVTSSTVHRESHRVSEIFDSGYDNQGSPRTSRSSEHSRQSSGVSSSRTDSREPTGDSLSGSDVSDPEDVDPTNEVVFRKIAKPLPRKGGVNQQDWHLNDARTQPATSAAPPPWGQIGGAHSLPRTKARTVHSISMPFYQYSPLPADDNCGVGGGAWSPPKSLPQSLHVMGGSLTLPRRGSRSSEVWVTGSTTEFVSHDDLISAQDRSSAPSSLVLRPLDGHRRTPTGSPVVKRIRRSRRESSTKGGRLRSPDRFPGKENLPFDIKAASEDSLDGRMSACSEEDRRSEKVHSPTGSDHSRRLGKSVLSSSFEDIPLASLEFDDELPVARSYNNELYNDILLNVTNKIIPEGDDYKLVFISSSSSKSSGVNSLDDSSGEASESSSRRVSSVVDESEMMVFIEESDWEGGESRQTSLLLEAGANDVSDVDKVTEHTVVLCTESGDTVAQQVEVTSCSDVLDVCTLPTVPLAATYQEIVESLSPTHSVEEVETDDHVLKPVNPSDVVSLTVTGESLSPPSTSHIAGGSFYLGSCREREESEQVRLRHHDWHPVTINTALSMASQVSISRDQLLGASYLEPSPSSSGTSNIRVTTQMHPNRYFNRSDSARSSGERSMEELSCFDHVLPFPTSPQPSDLDDDYKNILSEIRSYTSQSCDDIASFLSKSHPKSLPEPPPVYLRLSDWSDNSLSPMNWLALSGTERSFNHSQLPLQTADIRQHYYPPYWAFTTPSTNNTWPRYPTDLSAVPPLEVSSALSTEDFSEIDTASTACTEASSVKEKLDVDYEVTAVSPISEFYGSVVDASDEWEYRVGTGETSTMALQVNLSAETESHADANVETQSVHCTVDDDTFSISTFSEDGLGDGSPSVGKSDLLASLLGSAPPADTHDFVIQSEDDKVCNDKIFPHNSDDAVPLMQTESVTDASSSNDSGEAPITANTSASLNSLVSNDVSVTEDMVDLERRASQGSISNADSTSEMGVMSLSSEGIEDEDEDFEPFPTTDFAVLEKADTKSVPSDQSVSQGPHADKVSAKQDYDQLNVAIDTDKETKIISDTTSEILTPLSPGEPTLPAYLTDSARNDGSGNLVYYLGPQGTQSMYLVRTDNLVTDRNLETNNSEHDVSKSHDLDAEIVFSGDDRTGSDTDSQDTVIEGESYKRMRQLAIQNKIIEANEELNTLDAAVDTPCASENVCEDTATTKVQKLAKLDSEPHTLIVGSDLNSQFSGSTEDGEAILTELMDHAILGDLPSPMSRGSIDSDFPSSPPPPLPLSSPPLPLSVGSNDSSLQRAAETCAEAILKLVSSIDSTLNDSIVPTVTSDVNGNDVLEQTGSCNEEIIMQVDASPTVANECEQPSGTIETMANTSLILEKAKESIDVENTNIILPEVNLCEATGIEFGLQEKETTDIAMLVEELPNVLKELQKPEPHKQENTQIVADTHMVKTVDEVPSAMSVQLLSYKALEAEGGSDSLITVKMEHDILELTTTEARNATTAASNDSLGRTDDSITTDNFQSDSIAVMPDISSKVASQLTVTTGSVNQGQEHCVETLVTATRESFMESQLSDSTDISSINSHEHLETVSELSAKIKYDLQDCSVLSSGDTISAVITEIKPDIIESDCVSEAQNKESTEDDLCKLNECEDTQVVTACENISSTEQILPTQVLPELPCDGAKLDFEVQTRDSSLDNLSVDSAVKISEHCESVAVHDEQSNKTSEIATQSSEAEQLFYQTNTKQDIETVKPCNESIIEEETAPTAAVKQSSLSEYVRREDNEASEAVKQEDNATGEAAKQEDNATGEAAKQEDNEATEAVKQEDSKTGDTVKQRNETSNALKKEDGETGEAVQQDGEVSTRAQQADETSETVGQECKTGKDVKQDRKISESVKEDSETRKAVKQDSDGENVKQYVEMAEDVKHSNRPAEDVTESNESKEAVTPDSGPSAVLEQDGEKSEMLEQDGETSEQAKINGTLEPGSQISEATKLDSKTSEINKLEAQQAKTDNSDSVTQELIADEDTDTKSLSAVEVTSLQELIANSRKLTQPHETDESSEESPSVLEKYYTCSLGACGSRDKVQKKEAHGEKKLGLLANYYETLANKESEEEMSSIEVDASSEVPSDMVSSDNWDSEPSEWIDDSDTTFSDSASSDEASFDREEELRGFSRTIDFSLHTIIEESCEESESEREKIRGEKTPQPPEAPSDLEKYFSFTIGDTLLDLQKRRSLAEDSEASDTYSETSGSVCSESVPTVGEDVDPATLASSRLEKYFMTGFLGLEHYAQFDDPYATDESGSVGSGSEISSITTASSFNGSPHSNRKKDIAPLTSAANVSTIKRKKASSAPNRDGNVSDGSSSTLSDSDDHPRASEEDSTEAPFEKNDGFDTIKRKKKTTEKQQQNKSCSVTNIESKIDERSFICPEDPESCVTPVADPAEELLNSSTSKASEETDVCAALDPSLPKASQALVESLLCDKTDVNPMVDVLVKPSEVTDLQQSPDIQSNVQTIYTAETRLLSGDKPCAADITNAILSLKEEPEVSATPLPDSIVVPGTAIDITLLDKVKQCGLDRKQQSRDSGFIGSSDDLLKDSADALEDSSSAAEETSTDAAKSIGDAIPEIDFGVGAAEASKDEDRQVETSSQTGNKKKLEASSSDDETRYIVGQLMEQITKGFSMRMNGSPLLPRAKPPELEAFEAELTKLMQTVPGIDATVKEIVEELSSTDYYSDSYESSDYTNSDFDGPTRLGFLRRSIRSSLRSNDDTRLHWSKDGATGLLVAQENAPIVGEPSTTEGGVLLGDLDDGLREDANSPFTRETIYIYDRLMTSLGKMAEQASKESSDSEHPGNESPSSTRSRQSATLQAVQHIRDRLASLMREVHTSPSDGFAPAGRVRRNNSSSSSSSWMGISAPRPHLETVSTLRPTEVLDNSATKPYTGSLHADITRWLAKQQFNNGDEQSISSTSSTTYESEDSPTDTELSLDSDDMSTSAAILQRKDSKKGIASALAKRDRANSDITIVDDDLAFRSLDTPETLFATHKIGAEANPLLLEARSKCFSESSLRRLKSLQERGVMDLQYFVTQGSNNEYEVWQSMVVDKDKFTVGDDGSNVAGGRSESDTRQILRARHLLDSLRSSSSDTLQCISEEDLDSKPSSSRTSVLGSSTNIWSSSQSSLADGKRGSLEALGSTSETAQSPLPERELSVMLRKGGLVAIDIPLSETETEADSGAACSTSPSDSQQYRSSFHTEVLDSGSITNTKDKMDFRSSLHLWLESGGLGGQKPTPRAMSADPLPQDYSWSTPNLLSATRKSKSREINLGPAPRPRSMGINLSDNQLDRPVSHQHTKYSTIAKSGPISMSPPRPPSFQDPSRPKASTLPRIGGDTLHANVSFLHKTPSSFMTNPPPPTAAPSSQSKWNRTQVEHQVRREVQSWPAEEFAASIESLSQPRLATKRSALKSAPPIPEGKGVAIPQISVSDITESHPSGRSSLCSHGNNSDRESMPEEDIDRLVAMHKTRSSLSSLGTRSDSMTSVYSAAGGGRYGTVVVRGEAFFSLSYNYKLGALEVHIKQCRDLASVDTKRSRSDPYVKIYLLPDKSKSGKRKTKVKKHTLNPVFDEVLRFNVTISELETRTLWLTVWHSDMFGRNDFLGEVMLPLGYEVFEDVSPKWYMLQERLGPPDEVVTYKGELTVALKFVPPDVTTQKKGKQAKGSLHVLVKEARNLTAVRANGTSDPFCKSYLLPDKGKVSKQKTHVIKKNCNPKWNHTFVYDDVNIDELHDRCLELTVWDYDRLTSNDFLGGVRLSLGTGRYQGKEVDWLDSSGEEIVMWQSMLERPNMWVDGILLLQPTMEKRS